MAHSSDLSAEQLRRMEENRKKARERLANKRSAPVTTSATSSLNSNTHFTSQCPPAKRPALVTDAAQSSRPSNNVSSSTHNKYQEPNRFKSQSCSSPSTAVSFSTATVTAHCNNPSSLSSLNNKPTTSVTSHHGSHTQPFLSSSKTSGPSSTQLSSSLHPFGASNQPPSISKQLKFVEMQKKIKANMMLISKTRFKVLVPYETNVIEIFKRMPTRSYGGLKVMITMDDLCSMFLSSYSNPVRTTFFPIIRVYIHVHENIIQMQMHRLLNVYAAFYRCQDCDMEFWN